MILTVYLPTNDEWCGTFDGGFVQCTIINNKQPIGDCDWIRQIIIVFSGNDDYMLAKRYEIEEVDIDKETVKALELVANIPLPVTQDYLMSIGFEL